MQPPTVQTYDQAYGSLGNIYDPQTSLVNQQVAALPGEYAPQFSALDQAKVNAFKSIDNSANAKGMLFSGFSPDQQAQYVGTKYLPAVAGLKTQQQQRTFALQDQLNKINAARSTQAQGTIAEQGKALNQYYKDQQDAQYKQAQLRLSAQRSRGGGGGGGKAVDPLNEFSSYISNQFKNAGGQGSKNVTRQNQDAWVNQWFDAHGVDSPQARQVYWDHINSTYGRSSNPYADWRYAR